MFNADEILARYLDQLEQVNPQGRKFVKTPWQDLAPEDQARLPLYLKAEFPIREILLVSAWLMVLVGIFSPFGVSLAFGVGFLVTMHLSTRRAWKATAACEITHTDFPVEIGEKAAFEVAITVKNTSPKTRLNNVIVSIRCRATLREFQCQILQSIAPGGFAVARFPMTADRGMGLWPLSGLTVTLYDTLGLKKFSLEQSFQADIQVNPEMIPLSRFEIKRAGLSLHSGDFEVKASGFSTSFLGLRDWRQGDSLSHVDWKRSLRTGTMLVKDFERMCATDATIFLDTAEFGHGEFDGTSTLETMKDSALSAIRCLIAQQVQVQVISADAHIPLGKSQEHIDYVTQYIRDLQPRGDQKFTQIVLDHLHLVPVDSVAVLLFSTANSDLSTLLQAFILLEERRIETNLVVINTESFFAKIRKDANFDGRQNQMIEYIVSQIGGQVKGREVNRVLNNLIERTYFIEPGATFADVYNLKHGR